MLEQLLSVRVERIQRIQSIRIETSGVAGVAASEISITVVDWTEGAVFETGILFAHSVSNLVWEDHEDT